MKGYKLLLVMPESMSVERRRLMQAYGASFDLTPREGGMKAAIARAEELKAQTPGAWIPQQFENLANIDIHIRTTAQEILADFPDGVDLLITGGSPAPHPIQGIGAGFVPKNLHTDLLDGVIQVEAETAREFARRSAREEGLLVGISSGATLAAIASKLPELPPGATVLGFNYDTGERYLSVPDFLPS